MVWLDVARVLLLLFFDKSFRSTNCHHFAFYGYSNRMKEARRYRTDGNQFICIAFQTFSIWFLQRIYEYIAPSPIALHICRLLRFFLLVCCLSSIVWANNYVENGIIEYELPAMFWVPFWRQRPSYRINGKFIFWIMNRTLFRTKIPATTGFFNITFFHWLCDAFWRIVFKRIL